MKEFTSFNDAYFRDSIKEHVARSWYQGDAQLHPFEGETVPNYDDFNPDGKYSWSKAPRFKDMPMQVGPLAQVLVGYAKGDKLIKGYVDGALERAGSLAGVRVGSQVLHSTLGRHLARAIRAAVLSDYALKHWQLLVQNIGRGDYTIMYPPTFPAGEQQGFGFHEAPRGALSHWIVIKNGHIKNYQCVVPSTWNAGPRDLHDLPGPYEASLVGNPIADHEKPLEVLRTVHSFDPCIACAVHLLHPEGGELSTVRAL